MDRNCTSASPATAFASRVLPVPGGPTSRTPLGTLAPRRVNLEGSFKNSTISWSSAFSSSAPATSAKVTLRLDFPILAFALLNLTAPPAPPPMRFISTIMTMMKMTPMITMGRRLESSQDPWDSGRTSYPFNVPDASCSAMVSPKSA